MFTLFVFLVVAAVQIQGQLVNLNDLYCRSCIDAARPEDCRRYERCGPNEMCYAQAYTDNRRQLAYRMGCQGKWLCSLAQSAPKNGSACFECCSTRLCNLNLCRRAITAGPPKSSTVDFFELTESTKPKPTKPTTPDTFVWTVGPSGSSPPSFSTTPSSSPSKSSTRTSGSPTNPTTSLPSSTPTFPNTSPPSSTPANTPTSPPASSPTNPSISLPSRSPSQPSISPSPSS